MKNKKASTNTSECETEIIEAIAERLAADVAAGKTTQYELWELPGGDDSVFKKAESLTDDEIRYVTERLHWLATAALNQIALVTGARFPVVLAHFNQLVEKSYAEAKHQGAAASVAK
jgi:hypothetical protein